MNDNEDERLLTAEARAACDAVEPPARFAEGVVAAWQRERRPARRFRWPVALASALTLAMAAAFLLWLQPPSWPGARGDRVVAARTTLALGRRASAVAEAGSSLAWQTTADGTTRVQQRAGDVFYRVDKGGPFVVSTAAGDVTVLGTCFRVEALPMDKRLAMAAGLGAMAATTLLVTVYEGRVLLANEHGRAQIGAGERGTASGAGAPRSLADEALGQKLAQLAKPMAPPAADATRADLLRRDADQRAELAQLRAELRLSRGPLGAPFGENAPGEDFFKPSQAEAQLLAKSCTVRADGPNLSSTPDTMSDEMARAASVNDEERAQFDRVTADFTRSMNDQVRSLYVEVTGDKTGAEALTPQAMMNEIHDKVPSASAKEAYWRLSQERAGLLAPPTDTSGASAFERFLRLQAGGGDAYESALGAAIGVDRAHSLRTAQGGWQTRYVNSVGCPSGHQN
jgi:hypothetical protein